MDRRTRARNSIIGPEMMTADRKALLPADIRLLIENTAEDFAENNIPLERAVQQFTERYNNFLSGKHLKQHI